MILIYINEIGLDYKGQKQYEFIFSQSDEIDIDEWFTVPAASTSTSKCPDIEYVDFVGLLKDTDLKLELIQDSDYFGVIDAVDGVIALGWETFDFDSEYERLTFRFGESLEIVNRKLKQRNFYLLKENIQTENN
jgi:hypothetical protein